MKNANTLTEFDPKFNLRFPDITSLIASYAHEKTSVSFKESKKIEGLHFHSYCEIYINISGDVNFLVEDKVYKIKRGDILITKPNEFHKCIFPSECLHEHICIWLETPYSSPFLDVFMKKNRGENNLISLPQIKKEEVLNLCYEMEKLNTDSDNRIETLSILLKIIAIISNAKKVSESSKAEISETTQKALSYINKNYVQIDNIKEVSDFLFVSQSTLYRSFIEDIKIPPKKYLDNKKLSFARQLLENGDSVTEACMKSGFSDCSHFISVFKKHFNVTPSKIKAKK